MPRQWQFDGGYRQCSQLGNASEVAPATALLSFWPLPVGYGLVSTVYRFDLQREKY